MAFLYLILKIRLKNDDPVRFTECGKKILLNNTYGLSDQRYYKVILRFELIVKSHSVPRYSKNIGYRKLY